MDSGTIVYKGTAFITTYGEPYYGVRQGTATGIEADGRPLVRLACGAFEPSTGWRSDRLQALRDAIDQLDAVAERFSVSIAAVRAKAASEVQA